MALRARLQPGLLRGNGRVGSQIDKKADKKAAAIETASD